jgi:hypothetical protein
VRLLLAGVSYGLLLWLTRAVTSLEVMSIFSDKEGTKDERFESVSV